MSSLKTYHFYGFIKPKMAFYDIDTEIEAYSEKQAYYKLSLDLYKEIKIPRKELYFILKNSRTLNVNIKR